MNSVFILYNGIGDGEYIISVHKSLEDGKVAGDEYLKNIKKEYMRIEEWEFDNKSLVSFWDKAHYDFDPKHSYDWRKV